MVNKFYRYVITRLYINRYSNKFYDYGTISLYIHVCSTKILAQVGESSTSITDRQTNRHTCDAHWIHSRKNPEFEENFTSYLDKSLVTRKI